jgi:hypothetical protein
MSRGKMGVRSVGDFCEYHCWKGNSRKFFPMNMQNWVQINIHVYMMGGSHESD